MIYISTDYVFDGKKPPYMHDDQPHPLNDYGLSKLDGEVVTLEQSKGIKKCMVHKVIQLSQQL